MRSFFKERKENKGSLPVYFADPDTFLGVTRGLDVFSSGFTQIREKWLSFLATTHLFSCLFSLFSERMALYILNLFQFGSF